MLSGASGFDNFDRVAAGANHVAERLDLGTAIGANVNPR